MPSAAASRSSEMHDEDVDYGNDDDNHDMNDEDRVRESCKIQSETCSKPALIPGLFFNVS